MNYTPNETPHRRGDIVIHDSDAKEPIMLMRIVGFSRDGLVKTQYVSKTRRRTILKNDMKFLHEPERFGLRGHWGDSSQETISRIQSEWQRVRRFNYKHPVGTVVKTTSADGGFTTKTGGEAYIDAGGTAMIWLERGGNWGLRFVEPVEQKEQSNA